MKTSIVNGYRKRRKRHLGWSNLKVCVNVQGRYNEDEEFTRRKKRVAE